MPLRGLKDADDADDSSRGPSSLITSQLVPDVFLRCRMIPGADVTNGPRRPITARIAAQPALETIPIGKLTSSGVRCFSSIHSRASGAC